ncbi:bifunctional phosphopantothenoylcysteine decarboxylase/phosphopantothenate--cysteine ligase CoaBC [Corynebacterium uterequi]|uniref:Coenzyme A biosynthesis bifunctional protein CoaBC n=1 Tax=Corynebacterium uterequi TaxID=1072256 RepID=A0A0G3HEN8_9CORY|nr:bifunctional phosphopantothenoylcysteine decarboxylase/phosphopantothenate--cysteine ligase CoaBC [Corynebacterium uterequi]AKK11180.1 Phosphopantothenoylcysteine decarboxylase; Phosphopantothenate-cysteine ligase [Corynebacterium uterequi]
MGLKVVLGVGGGIAAYKACQVVRDFTEAGDDVRVVPTPAALNFVGSATFEALSGHPVSTTVFDAVDEVQHVRIGQEADLVVVAPATADLLARLAAGRADDLLTASVLVATCPVVIVPAMHTEMWKNPAVRRNVELLREFGYVVMEPAHGRLTGADSGPGRLPDPAQIADFARSVARGHRPPRSLAGRRVLITAGGTQENIDPVRYIGNRSSGRQGFALGEVAAQAGARVTMVVGDTDALSTPAGAEVVRVRSTRQMHAAVQERAAASDLIIMAAAVADFRPLNEADSKLKKGSADDALRHVDLVENPDILRDLVDWRRAGVVPAGTIIVGFAAETEQPGASVRELARKKLQRKGCDFLMCNDVSGGAVFGQDRNSGWLLAADGRETVIADGSKLDVAMEILTHVAGERILND